MFHLSLSGDYLNYFMLTSVVLKQRRLKMFWFRAFFDRLGRSLPLSLLAQLNRNEEPRLFARLSEAFHLSGQLFSRKQRKSASFPTIGTAYSIAVFGEKQNFTW